ncbi:MAG: TerC/Alx family metal homeostasis membrane protein [Sphingomonadales bacterium]
MEFKLLFLTGFLILVTLGLVLDLGLLGKEQKTLTSKQALWRTIGWITAGLMFSLVIYFFHHDLHNLQNVADYRNFKDTYGSNFIVFDDVSKCRESFSKEAFVGYITGYFVEYSLSVDNLFVMLLIFNSFGISLSDQKRILVWGVIGAVLMRFLFIFLGGLMIQQFHWMIYLFGGFLIITGLKMLFTGGDDETIDTENHRVFKWVSRFFRISREKHHGKFFIVTEGKRYATLLFVVLVLVEFTDVLFAVDSVPAIFGVTRDPYLVFFSNIFAIMGLRSLFFLLGHGIKNLSTLEYGLSLILIFIGVKMIFQKQLQNLGFNEVHALLVLGSILVLTYVSSFLFPKKPVD